MKASRFLSVVLCLCTVFLLFCVMTPSACAETVSQPQGILALNYSGSSSGWIDVTGEYKAIRVKAKNYLPMDQSTETDGRIGYSIVLRVTMDNGKFYAFRIINDTSVRYCYNRFGADGATTGWDGFTWLDSKEPAAAELLNGAGADFKVARTAANVLTVTFNGKVLDTYTMEGVTENNKVVSVGFKQYGNPSGGSYAVEVPYVATPARETVNLQIPGMANGKVTADKASYLTGDTVTLTVAPDSGYSYQELKVNGQTVSPDNNGKYSFVAQEANYQISASFVKSAFAGTDGSHWTLTHQGAGKLIMNKHSSGFSGWVNALTDGNDISTVVKDYTPDAKDLSMIYKFVFANGETFIVRLEHTNADGKYRVQTMSGSTLTPEWKNYYVLNDAQAAKTKGDGIRFRMAIEGTNAAAYLDGTKVCTIDLSKIVATGKPSYIQGVPVRVSMRMDGNLNKAVTIPFELKNTVTKIEEIALPNVVTRINAPDGLFFRNDNLTNLPDPSILDNTARDGYYYMYGTWGAFLCYRSKNMMDWEYCGEALQQYRENNKVWDSKTGKYSYQVLANDLWAPEVVYDASTNLYYMFFSATPDLKGQAVKGKTKEVLMVATSTSPSGNFQLVNFKNAASCGSGNVHSYSTSTYSDYFAPYLLLDPAKHRAFSEKINNEWRGANNGGYAGCIDPHPYVAPNGQKYLLWVDSYGPDRICGVEMENWLKPKWETATVLTYHGYYTVNDWKNGSTSKVSYENYTTTNEGPFIVEHNGKYYLTYSANNWKNNSYLVAQAVSNSVLGPYTKLKEAEGGVVLSGMRQNGKNSSGTGHHSIIKVGNQLFMVYHRHNDPTVGGGQRNHAIDEIKWVTINGREVMYVNGPNVTLQPRVEKHSTYRNIAGEASVASTGGNVKYLNDGLLSHYKSGNSSFVKAIGETTISGTTTFTFAFADARAVKSVMVYNSRLESQIFRQIKQIKLLCLENGKLVTKYINGVPFNSEYYTTNSSGKVTYVEPCAAAYAVFDEQQVLSVEITIEVPAGQSSVGISEIRILGK